MPQDGVNVVFKSLFAFQEHRREKNTEAKTL